METSDSELSNKVSYTCHRLHSVPILPAHFLKLLIQQYGGLTVLLEKVRTQGTRSTRPKAQTRPKTRLSTVTGHSTVLRRVLEGRGPQARPQRVPRVAGLGILKANDP